MSNNNVDLISLRNNFVSIEFFNLEQNLKQFLLDSKKRSLTFQEKAQTLQQKVPETTLDKKNHIITSLEGFDICLQRINKIVSEFYDFIEDSYSLKEQKTGMVLSKKPQTKPKKRAPNTVKKPKKPKDL